jgi:hypothetical protein
VRRLLLALAPLGWVVLVVACPFDNPSQDGADGGVADAGDDGSTDNPPLRQVTFDGITPGDYAGGTIDGVTLTVGPYNGGQSIQVQNLLGEGQDLELACGAVSAHTPELHRALAIVFNDDNATLLVSVFDQNGQLLTARPIDTRQDAQALGITRVDPIYKRLDARIQGGNQLIGSVSIASCQGFVHAIVVQ